MKGGTIDREIRRVNFSGGAIVKPRKKSPKRKKEIEEALATRVGGAIRNVKKKSPKKDEKIQQALATKVGGSLKFYDKTHKYMYNKLSGHGAKRDSAQCRTMMYSIMKNYHPNLWNSYIAGSVKDLPRFENDHLQTTAKSSRPDSRADVVDSGGSLAPLSHSENGFLTAHNDEFHHFYEII